MLKSRRLRTETALHVLRACAYNAFDVVRKAHSKSGVNVILEQTVEKLGQGGQQVEASRGFARNFLVPGGLARQLPKLRKKISEPGQAAEVKRLRGKGTAAISAQNLEHVLNMLYNRPVEIVRKTKSWPKAQRSTLRQPVTAACIARAVLEQHKVALSPQLISAGVLLRTTGVQEVPLQLVNASGDRMNMRVRINTQATKAVDYSDGRLGSVIIPSTTSPDAQL